MEKVRTRSATQQDLNGNTPHIKTRGDKITKSGTKIKKKRGRISRRSKDTLITPEGRIFYPCTFCNKVFPIRKTRNAHVLSCPEKDLLSSDDEGHSPKVEIKQNIVLNEQKPRLSPQSGEEAPLLSSPEKSAASAELRQAEEPKSEGICNFDEGSKTESPKKEAKTAQEFTCTQCKCDFDTSMELLRHTRRCNNYPKVVMASSEVRKYFGMKDRSKCPICDKPMKTGFRSAFVKHLTTHTNDMNFECPVCRQKFRRKDHMKAHQKRHVFTGTD